MTATYMPDYFELRLPVQEQLVSLKEVPLNIQGLFFHEYIHFLQNITTLFGLSRTWNTYDRIRQLIVSVQQENKPIELPYTGNDAAQKQLRNSKFLFQLLGDKEFKIEKGLDYTLKVDSIEYYRDEYLDENLNKTHATYVRLHLNSMDKCYEFGFTAIAESMVYLLEKKFYTLELPDVFPYESIQKVVEFILPTLLESDELVFALCDISLMHQFPGWAFCQILEYIKERQIEPKCGEEIIDIGFQFYSEKGWRTIADINDCSIGAGHIIGILYNNEFFKHTKQWIQTIINNGAKLRISQPYFMLEIFRDHEGLGRGLANPVSLLGGPHCINLLDERFMLTPIELADIKDNIHPQHLIALWQINDFLLQKSKRCRLYPICQTSKPNIVDERCKENPLNRLKDELLCPYASILALLGFDKKEFML